MKAIAEYFRDLAAGDRFFGAEPPQPDTDMLHRIAEQTIQSRVNAEVQDNSLILRQDHADGTPTPEHTAPAAAPAVAAAPAPVAVPEPAPEPVVAQSAPQQEPQPIAASSNFGEGDSIAEKLQRIRAVVSRENAEPAEVSSFYSEDQHAEEIDTAEDAAPVEDPVAPVEEYEFEDSVPDVPHDVLSSVMTDLADTPDEEEEAQADTSLDVTSDDADDFEPQDEDVFAQDAAIDPWGEEENATTDETDADELAEAIAETEAADTAAEGEETDADTETEFEMEAEAEVEAEAEPEVETNAAEDEVEDGPSEAQALAEAGVEEDAAADADPVEMATPALKPRRRIIVQKISRADVEAAQASSMSDNDADTEAHDEDAQLDAEAEAALMRELAEVEAEMEADVEVEASQDDADLEEANHVEADQDEADHDEAADIEVAEAEDENAEADALAKVIAEATAETETEAEAEVEIEAEAQAEQYDDMAEVDEAAEDATDEDQSEEETRAARLARRSILVEDEDAALNRLMDATSSRMSDDDEGAVRRASIAHLKAAVAATKADDSIAKAAADEEERELDQYRSDLARVVRPGRARPRAEGSTSRPAPLMLVSEQRIDNPAPEAGAAAADIRPRRITTGNLALEEEFEEEADENLFNEAGTESFGEYAARYAALELPDLLEAAAAHYTFVEGTPNFTRPMLMRKISSISTKDGFSREAGLRTFGSLLREGKIVKGEDGKFVISGKTRFTPEAREAGE